MNPAIGDGLVWVSCQGGKIANKGHMLQCEVEVINIWEAEQLEDNYERDVIRQYLLCYSVGR